MKNRFLFIPLVILLFAVNCSAQNRKFQPEKEKKSISQLFEILNSAAANADFQKYFDCYADESTFIGTDATEIWNKQQFMIWAKPYFDKNKTWNFKSLKRNIFFSKDGTYAWFDEILDTQMKICRGSGVLERIKGQWKIKQYVLSMTVPNEVSKEVIKIKTPVEEDLISHIKKN